jgi:hypothetical protein
MNLKIGEIIIVCICYHLISYIVACPTKNTHQEDLLGETTMVANHTSSADVMQSFIGENFKMAINLGYFYVTHSSNGSNVRIKKCFLYPSEKS